MSHDVSFAVLGNGYVVYLQQQITRHWPSHRHGVMARGGRGKPLPYDAGARGTSGTAKCGLRDVGRLADTA
jgi:hypothetical protein